tara:strand:+ start:660 stop:1277 length:618 start_codon:yes stop_codon:yes gene_type:complete
MKKLILLLLFIPSVSLAQDTIPATKILTQKEVHKKKMMKLKKEYKTNHKGKIKPGNTSFNSNDRIAIKDVIDAYGFYWDSNNLDGYLSLFIDKAIGVTVNAKGEKDKYYIKSGEQIESNKKRMNFFKINQMQRRHMMSNTLILELSKSYAHIRQYMTLITTNKKEKTEILTPVDYIFKLKKVEGVWKIVYREINLDKPLDLPLSK